jgi:hypothetical protein
MAVAREKEDHGRPARISSRFFLVAGRMI